MPATDHLNSIVSDSLNESHRVLTAFLDDSEQVARISSAAVLMADAIQKGNKILSCGDVNYWQVGLTTLNNPC